MGTFSNTPDAKREAHDLPVDTRSDVRYTDVVSRESNPDLERDKSRKSVRTVDSSKSSNSRKNS